MKNNSRVALISFNIDNYYSLASGYLRAYALKRSEKLRGAVNFIPLDFSVNQNDIYQVLYYLSRVKPYLICFSCYCWNMNKINKLSRLIKEVLPESKIIYGGPEAGPIAEKILRENPAVDVVVRGEGEATFKELLEYYLTGHKNLFSIKGISYRSGDKVIRNRERKLISNLDEIPSPYLENILPLRDKVLYLETYRGCPYKCSYCYEGKNYPHLRYFSKERIEKELGLILNSDTVKSFTFTDSIFNLNKKKLREISELIAKNNTHNKKMHTIEIFSEKVDRETVKEFKRAGVVSVETGPQSVNEDTLKAAQRYFNREKFSKGVKLLQENEIDVLCDLIVGLPEDNFFKFVRSIKFVFKLKPHRVIFSTLHVLPGTVFYRKSEEYGLKFNPQPPRNVLENNTFSHTEIRRAELMASSYQKEYNLAGALRS